MEDEEDHESALFSNEEHCSYSDETESVNSQPSQLFPDTPSEKRSSESSDLSSEEPQSGSDVYMGDDSLSDSTQSPQPSGQTIVPQPSAQSTQPESASPLPQQSQAEAIPLQPQQAQAEAGPSQSTQVQAEAGPLQPQQIQSEAGPAQRTVMGPPPHPLGDSPPDLTYQGDTPPSDQLTEGEGVPPGDGHD